MQSQKILLDSSIHVDQSIDIFFNYGGFHVDCKSGKAEKIIDGYKLTINFGLKENNHESLKKKIDQYNEESILYIIKSIDASGLLAEKESGNNSIYKLILNYDGNGIPNDVKMKYLDKKNTSKIKSIKDYEKKIESLESKSRNNGSENIQNNLEKIQDMERIVELMTTIKSSNGLYKVSKNVSSQICAVEPQPSDSKESDWENYLNKSVSILSTLNTITSQLGTIYKTLIKFPLILLEPILNNRTWTDMKNVSGELSKVTVILLWNIPLKLYQFGNSLKKMYDVKDAEDKNKFYDACLLATAAFGDIIEMPDKIAHAIEMFKPLMQVGLWGNILGAVAAVFSIAQIVFSARSYMSSRDQLRELESESLSAYLNQLKNLVNEGKVGEDVLRCLESNKENILNKIEEQLKGLADIKNHSDADKFIADIQAELAHIPSSSLKTQLLAAGDAAFIECVLKKQESDKDFLDKHFKVDGEKLDIKLKEITSLYNRKVTEGDANSSEYIRKAALNLKTRVSDTITSEALSLTSHSVTLVTCGIFVLIGFSIASGVLSPIGYALAISVAIFSLAKIYDEWERKKEFENAMGLVDL